MKDVCDLTPGTVLVGGDTITMTEPVGASLTRVTYITADGEVRTATWPNRARLAVR